MYQLSLAGIQPSNALHHLKAKHWTYLKYKDQIFLKFRALYFKKATYLQNTEEKIWLKKIKN